ncbi:MAG: cob(I)yrinic acid a,c-diamide adenosyltransferase [Pirellulaceae bacterium]|nr:cob(I)yrinic acid a,c-diamide adenosyltransferase [Pirellulaceae bacterium]
MTIYTRAGDDGKTDLPSGRRVPKNAARLEACGELDELDSLLGAVRCQGVAESTAALLMEIQRLMVPIRAELVSAPSAGRADAVGAAEIERLERAIDGHSENLAPLTTFIVPGGCPAAAWMHVARAVCRRAERRLAALAQVEPAAVSPSLSAYINRLGDLLFVLARKANAEAGVEETPC